MNIGKRLNKLRNMKNITQLELANILFVSDKTISSWESNRTKPNLEMLVKLAEILSCNVGYLIYGDNPKDNVETEIKIKISEKEYVKLSILCILKIVKLTFNSKIILLKIFKS